MEFSQIKKIVALVALATVTSMANQMNTGGNVGVSRTVSTYTLGEGSINTGLSIQGDLAGNDVWLYDANGKVVSEQTAILLSQDIYFAYGITNWLDISVDLPFYQDIWSNHTDNAVGLGDLRVGLKIEHPGLYSEAPFRMAYLLVNSFPTGDVDAGYFQRHTYTTTTGENKSGAFSNAGWVINPNMLWTLDMNKFPSRLPLQFHVNTGVIAQVAGEGARRQFAALLGSFAVEYQFTPNFASFLEISGESKLVNFTKGYNFITDLNSDVLKLTLGSKFQTKSGFNGSLGFDIGFADQKFARTDWSRKNDDGVVSKYSTTNTPSVGLNLSLGFSKKGENAKLNKGHFFTINDTVTIIKYDTLKIIQNDTVVVIEKDTVKVVESQGPQTIVEYGVMIMKNINFFTGAAEITTESYKVLDDLSTSLINYPNVEIEIRGYTDATGTAEINKKLSQDRAQAVVDYIVKKGIDKKRLTAIGMGASNPIASNNTADGRVLNRRVEIKRIDK